MPTLVKEDGTGLANANSYADAADAATYMDSRPHAGTNWSGASDAEKAQFLIMATLMIDSLFIFGGYKSHLIQALQWPRINCPDPNSPANGYRDPLAGYSSGYFQSNVIPPVLVQAMCEQAFQLSVGDLTGPAASTGLSAVEIFEAVKLQFDKGSELSPPIPSLVQAMLSKIGQYQSSRGGVARLCRA